MQKWIPAKEIKNSDVCENKVPTNFVDRHQAWTFVSLKYAIIQRETCKIPNPAKLEYDFDTEKHYLK